MAANEAIKEILRRDGKYAVVGLPCQIRAVRKAELINTKLKSRITLHLGIFCGSSSTFGATRFLLKRLGIAETEVQDIKYRCEGWPGHLTVQTSEGKISTDYRDYYDCRFGAFIPWRCTLCSDHTNELADVSFGDAWLPEFADDMTGTSVIISRSDSGEDILHRMLRRNIIDLTPISMDRVIASQNSAILFKKRELSARLKILRLLGKKTPTSSNELRLSPSSRTHPPSITLYSQRILASNEGLLAITKHLLLSTQISRQTQTKTAALMPCQLCRFTSTDPQELFQELTITKRFFYHDAHVTTQRFPGVDSF